MTTNSLDNIKCVLDESNSSLFLSATGEDRPHLIAEVSEKLDRQKLYIANMSFNLHIARQEISGLSYVPYEMEVLAKGDLADLKRAHEEISQQSLFEQPKVIEDPKQLFSFQHASMFHLALYTPDQPGLIAFISDVVSKSRPLDGSQVTGNFVHLFATTVNDGGPQGGTPYFGLRANVSVPNLQIQNEIIADLQKAATKRNIENDFWTSDLNQPA